MTIHAEHDIEREPTWTKPGPGTWDLDSSHSGPAPGPLQRRLMQESFCRGFAEGMAMFGAPLQGIELRWVYGKLYTRLVPLVGADKDVRPPPLPVLWLAARLHPEFRRQEKRAKESFETKRWRDELRRWEHEWKPRITEVNLGFARVDVAELSDDELGEHLTALHAHLQETATLHFRLHVSDMGPLGDLMVHLEEWGFARSDAFRALVGASPATRAPAELQGGIVRALREAGTDPSAIASLDDARAASPEAATLLEEYLQVNGWRLTTGYDIEDRCLVELPEVVVASIRAAATADPDDSDEVADRELRALRDEVPEEHRAVFDELVEDARLSYGLRDENGPLTFEWPAGLLRRAVLEAGRRLHGSDHLTEPEAVFELTVDEVTELLAGRTGPGPGEIAERAAERRWWASLEPPERLGPEEGPPPVAAMPPNLRRITRIVVTVMSAIQAEPGGEPLTGTGIGADPYVGTARVVHDDSEALLRVEPGDVIVAPYTAPTYNAVLAVAGGVVVEAGGLLSHAAVLARELGIPAVVGAVDAMTRIPDGATVEVDPVAGRVRVLR